MRRSVKKILVANRGEIAVRVLRTCRELGIRTVAVFSDVDRTSLHVRMADEAYALGGSTASESYLDQSKIIAIARLSNVDAIHPGYGFLSENPAFAAALEEKGIVFIGPPSTAIKALGDKTEARKCAQSLGIPTVPGTLKPLKDVEEARAVAGSIGYPVLLKAAAGGGGKGMRKVTNADELESALHTARSEAKSAFGDDRVYLEKYIEDPRHVEIQIIADRHGNTLWLGERECSIQRRHQKVMEESPSPIVDEEMRRQMGEAAVRIAASAGYVNAGTLEFIVDKEKKFYFLEMNTRLQVEHPVTEMVTGLDLVRMQIQIAEGMALHLSQEDIRRSGHAIECRIYAEDPSNDFFPSTGKLQTYRTPAGPRIRVDNGFEEGDQVQIYYDPMLAKVVAWGENRSQAISVMARALDEFRISGVRTTIPFCRFVLRHPEYVAGRYDTHFVNKFFLPDMLESRNVGKEIAAVIAAARDTLQQRPQVSDNGVNKPGNSESKWKEARISTYRS